MRLWAQEFADNLRNKKIIKIFLCIALFSLTSPRDSRLFSSIMMDVEETVFRWPHNLSFVVTYYLSPFIKEG